MTRQTGQRLTIVAQRPGSWEIPWAHFLLGDWAGEVVDDPDRDVLVPYSLVVTDRPGGLRGKALARVRRMGTVGLLHVSDKRYRAKLDAYQSFAWVWRTYYHSGLTDLDVRQIPLGPGLTVNMLAFEPSAAARRRPVERLYTWSVGGEMTAERRQMVEAMQAVEGGYEPPSRDAATDPATLLDVLTDSVFAPCESDDGHLESRRIYDALEVGAIPIVERRRWLDYFHELLGDHPLPTVRSWAEAPALVSTLLADQARLADLHGRVVTWWEATKRALAAQLQEDVARCFASMLRGAERDGTPLARPAPRWRGRVEVLRHRRL